MATSPGARGVLGVLEIAADRFSRNSDVVVGTFSLPNFYDNFKDAKITDETKLEELKQEISTLTHNQ